MLLQRNQVIVGLVFAAMLAVGTFIGIVFDRSWITGGIVVSASFHDAAGLEAGDAVMIAGLRAGAVESVGLDDNGRVVTELRITEPMPADTRASIALQNFLGKRVVKLHAGDAWERLLRDGDVIPDSRTSTPVDYAELNQETVRLLRGSDVDALAQLISSIADVTEGQREEVEALLEGLQDVTRVIAERRDELAAAIDRSEDVFAVLADEDREIVRIVDAFGSTLDRLAANRDDVTRLLRETAKASNAVADLVAEDRQQLDRALQELHRDLRIVDAHMVDVAHVLAYGGVSFEGYANITKSGPADNPYWGNVFTQSLGSLGVDVLFGCGGALDDFLDQVLGPDPRSCDDIDGGRDQHRTGGGTPSIRSLFGAVSKNARTP
ncbi:MAG: MCE family protein [Actinobacteria bacterium]|nr:MCE family protein [Actinomycetota bacterium]